MKPATSFQPKTADGPRETLRMVGGPFCGEARSVDSTKERHFMESPTMPGRVHVYARRTVNGNGPPVLLHDGISGA